MSPHTTILSNGGPALSSTADTLAGDETSVGSKPAARGRRGALERGAMLGRYIVLETLGRGGMGIVYAAYDPELDRKVALKLLLPGRGGESARIRLLREAQAIARLAHPNVVTVHDVGAVDQRVFIAMELVDGMDLGRWLAHEPRGAAEIIDRFLQAGAGLAAAHAADLVHRDFKPENVLVGHDGRARVVDFGLVRRQDDTPSQSVGLGDELPLEVSQRRASMSRDLRLTDAGSMVGTPAYMSPEQLMGQSGDARSDQFSFCVSLYEALYGERPFAGDSLPELSYAVLHGEVRAPPAQHRVPGRLRRVLLRGLAPDPPDRHPSMDVLLVALRTAAAPRRRWWAAGGVLVLGGGVGLWALLTPPDQACAGAADRAAVVWSPARQQALQQQLEQTALPFAADTWTRVQAHVDGELQRWAELQHQLCETNQALDPSVAAEDPRQLCLDERLAEVSNLLGVLGDADARVVTHAMQLAHGLAAMGDCADLDALHAFPRPSDPQLRAQVQELRAELQRWDLRTSVGLDPDSAETLQALVDRAEALGYLPLRADVFAYQSDQASKQGDVDRAIELENEAFETALASRHDLTAFQTASSLVFLHGVTRREPEPAHGWARRAEALHQRIGGEPGMRVVLLSAWASTYAIAGDDERALALYEEALEIARRDDDAARQATLLNNMGAFHAEQRRLPEALVYLEEAAAFNEDLYGPDHPGTLRTQANVAAVSIMNGRHEEGRARLEALLPRQEAVLGTDHAEVATTLESLAIALGHTGEPERSEALRRRVVQIREQVFGPSSPPVILAKNNLGSALLRSDRYAEARALGLEVLATLDAGVAAPRQRVTTLVHLSIATRHIGTPKEALAYAEQAQRLCDEDEATCLEDQEIDILLNLGHAHLEGGDRAAAKASFEEILRRPPSPTRPAIGVSARFGVAQAIVQDDREAALTMARDALEQSTAPDADMGKLAEEIEAWLGEQASATQRSPRPPRDE